MNDESQGSPGAEGRTARTVGQIVKYSHQINQSRTVEEVGSYALEATLHVLEGHPETTIVEVRGGDLDVVESTSPSTDEVSEIARYAYGTDSTILATGAESSVRVASDLDVLDPEELGTDQPDGAVTLAIPRYHPDETGDVGVVVLVRWRTLSAVEAYHAKPVEYLADHVATAFDNIRSRERLERARNDLETRKEMVELYDSLLRHDLGNDLQIVAGYSEMLLDRVDGEPLEHAETIYHTAQSAIQLIEDVGDLVKTLEEADEPEPRPLAPVLEQAVDDATAKFDDLTVAFDTAEFDYEVYAGDLLEAVFTNLVTNAAVHNDGPVTVSLSAATPTPDTVVVGVVDDGEGVPEEIRDDLFEMGRKGPDSDGTGFGLGFVRALTQSYGGTVELQDGDHSGAEFRVTLERA